MKLLFSLLLSYIFFFVGVYSLSARPNNIPFGKTLYDANCASCHGLDAKAHGNNIGGRKRADMYTTLITMRNMADEGKPVSVPLQKMLDILAGLNNEEIHAIADYTATLK